MDQTSGFSRLVNTFERKVTGFRFETGFMTTITTMANLQAYLFIYLFIALDRTALEGKG